MDYIIAVVNKYKERLNSNNDVKKILRALQKLNEVDMTIEILQETEVGKAVNKLKKVNGIGSFAKEIVLKWKKLLHAPEHQQSAPAINYSNQQNSSNEEYDPTKNWEMKSQKEKKSKVREEYDPTQNWQMKKVNLKKKRNLYENLDEAVYDHEMEENAYDHQDEENAIPSPSDDDDDYPSSRGEGSESYSDGATPDSYAPSVTSQTVSSKNHSSDVSSFQGRITDSLKKQKLSKSEKTLDRKGKTALSNHINYPVTENKNHKKHREASKKSAVPTSDSKLEAASKKLMNHKTVNNKRKAEEKSSISPKKRRNVEIVNKETRKVKRDKVKRADSSDLSFEQFMMMDTTKVKKKKKVKSGPNKSSSQTTVSKLVSKPSKVEIQLPKVQSNYRPLPSVPPPVDVKRTSSKSELMTDELAAALHTQRNSRKMQVYSGQKINHLPKMLSLYDQCMNVLLNNIDNLDVIGVPYDIIKPVLDRCSVEQLYRLEDANPYLLEDTGELWQRHAEQDFRGSEPDEMESWREMYLRLYDAREEKLARLTHSIQAKVDKAKPLEKRTKLAYVGIGAAKAPRNVLRAQMKYGTAGRKPIPYEPSSVSGERSSSSASSMKKQVSEIRLSVPPGAITASIVDNMAGNSRNANKKQVPRVAPMMAKTLKSINKLRYRR